ncbi:MAG: hypothetical protein L0Y71_15885 [Gemmataceae bacterium]|nr:hypothetical protein [Gemmataceae bacterium]
MVPPLPDDFRDFLKLCAQKRVKYLLIGGYAVWCHGYPRNTADMDVWIELSKSNVAKIVAVFRAFGYRAPDLCEELFLDKGAIVRMGVAPMRLEILKTSRGSRSPNAMRPANAFSSEAYVST